MNRYLEDLNDEKKESSFHYDDDKVDLSTILSTTSTYKETEHARLRRKQRCIDKKDLKTAMKYGKCEPHYYGKQRERGGKTHVVRYTYQDIVYIVNSRTKKEVTCYARPITLDKIPITRAMELSHHAAIQKVRTDFDCWTSHTVIVIDTSGSMRESDMWGTRNRLKSVWFSVALDFIAERLENGNATVTDVISVITMGESPSILIKEVPTTWILYNQIVKMYSSHTMNPQGHGCFLPSLDTAKRLLNRNSNASCAAALIFLSDGAPSDHIPMRQEKIIERVEALAKSFGRRLTFTAIGIGDLDDFSMLQSMVDAAKDYGAVAEFKLPSMTSSSLGQTFTSVATSLTTSQTEMTDLGTMKQRKIRKVIRESKSKASEFLTQVNDDDFWIYSIGDVKRKVYREWVDDRGMKQIYYDTVPLQHPDARFVAMSKGPFGEGAERFAYRFYEVAADGKTIVGRPLVAKESRMVLETEGGMTENEARKQFVRKFIMTQQIALRLAVKFNEKLKANGRVHDDTPQVSFLDCSIYELDDEALGKASVLVEEKLDHTKWYKWNSNNGMVEGVKNLSKPDKERHDLLYKNNGMLAVGHANFTTLNLDKIEEGSEEEDDDDESNHRKGNGVKIGKILFTPAQVAQAFSHFSYLQSDRKRLVCDLQGVYDKGKNVLQFSDPVIHYYNEQRADRRGVHGRTDRGRDGIKDFFGSHSCKEQGHLCQMITRGFRSTRRDQQRTVTSHLGHSSADRHNDGCRIS